MWPLRLEWDVNMHTPHPQWSSRQDANVASFKRQEAQLSQRDQAMLHVIESFAKSLKIIRVGRV